MSAPAVVLHAHRGLINAHKHGSAPFLPKSQLQTLYGAHAREEDAIGREVSAHYRYGEGAHLCVCALLLLAPMLRYSSHSTGTHFPTLCSAEFTHCQRCPGQDSNQNGNERAGQTYRMAVSAFWSFTREKTLSDTGIVKALKMYCEESFTYNGRQTHASGGCPCEGSYKANGNRAWGCIARKVEYNGKGCARSREHRRASTTVGKHSAQGDHRGSRSRGRGTGREGFGTFFGWQMTSSRSAS